MAELQITSQINIGLDQLLQSIAQREAELLEQINQALPEATQQRYDTLQLKRHNETITSRSYPSLDQALGVPELWQFSQGHIEIKVLQGQQYASVEKTEKPSSSGYSNTNRSGHQAPSIDPSSHKIPG